MPNPLDGLNRQQREAVKHKNGPLCVFAGPGSGKTRVLTCRIARLIEDSGVHPSHVMAVTFTRKAADEMKGRLRALVGTDEVYANTFHAFCFRTLQRHFGLIGGDNNFTIAGEDEQENIIRNLPAAENDPFVKFRDIILKIQNYKLAPNASRTDPAWLRDWYHPYQAALNQSNMLDFSDLLVNAVKLFTECPDLLARARNALRYIHVDEYQDTNYLQGKLANMLVGPRGNICVVGDDDQSIYGFQGAFPENIRRFTRQYPGARTITLEQNYRSRNTIVKASLAVIENNDDHIPKNLFTNNRVGSLIKIIRNSCDLTEAREIARTICLLHRPTSDLDYRDIAILFRSRLVGDNNLRNLRRELLSNGIPIGKPKSGALGQRELLGDPNYVVPDRDEVTLSTVHGAKGLEYKVVFMIGLEEGIFPDRRSHRNRNCFEEERRLFYVGMTRAKKLLYLSYAERRSNRTRIRSRFIDEIPPSLTR